MKSRSKPSARTMLLIKLSRENYAALYNMAREAGLQPEELAQNLLVDVLYDEGAAQRPSIDLEATIARTALLSTKHNAAVVAKVLGLKESTVVKYLNAYRDEIAGRNA